MPNDDIRNINTRRRNLFYLIHQYLTENGCYNAAEALKTEARLSDELEVCDNVDLDIIYLDYASFAELKFGKMPKVLKRGAPKVKVEFKNASQKRTTRPKTALKDTQQNQNQNSATLKNSFKSPPTPQSDEIKALEEEFQVNITKIETGNRSADFNTRHTSSSGNQELVKLQEIEHGGGNLGGDMLLNSQDWQSLAELLKSTILRDDMKLKWSDISGNQKAIEIIKEAVIAPIKYPQLFVNGLRPWKSVLLHGPPGSGKTLLAKVLYSETKGNVAFFNITSSIIISKWRGDSEKMLKMLFHLAHKHAPSVIFFDEIEGLISQRDRPTDHESSRRFKNEFLQLLDGLEEQSSGIFVLASSNLPWDIDEAFLRRFEKKILIELPNAKERETLINKLKPATMNIDPSQMAVLVKLSENFTGDEIRLACKEAAMQTVRSITNGAKGEKSVSLEKIFSQIRPLSIKSMDRYIKWQCENTS